MAKTQLDPINIVAWNVKTDIIEGGASGTVIDQLIINNSGTLSAGAVTTKITLYLVPPAGTAGQANAILSEKSIFRLKNYEPTALEGLFLSAGTKLIAEAIPSALATAPANPSLVIAGSYEDL